MNPAMKQAVWGQFGAAIDALEGAITACPEGLWGEGATPHAFWYLVFHALFWLDLYLSGAPEGFRPPAPFTLDELDPDGIYPERIYTRAELQSYLEHTRRKCRVVIAEMTDERAAQPSGFERLGVNHAELLIYNLRHVQHHAGQLQLLLRQRTDSAPRWVRRTSRPLEA